MLPFFKPTDPKGKIHKTAVINRGNAKENGIGFFDMVVQEHIFDILFNSDICVVEDRLYINALGDVLLDPDLSYEDQKNHIAGNVLQKDLDSIIIQKHYSPLNELKGFSYEMTIVAEKGTIGDEETTDKRTFESFSKAIFAFNNFVSNLQMNPKPEPAEVLLTVESNLYNNVGYGSNLAAKAEIQYFDLFLKYIGKVTVTIKLMIPEDKNG